MSVHGGLKSLGRNAAVLGRIGNSIAKAQENANAVLHLPSSLPSDALNHVKEHLPGLNGLQERIQSNAKQAWSDYETALSEHPMRTKALTSCVGLTVADLIAQLAEGGGFDVLRTCRMASFGLLWHGISVRTCCCKCTLILICANWHGFHGCVLVVVRARVGPLDLLQP